MENEKGLNPSREYLKTLTVAARIKLAESVNAKQRYLDQVGKSLRTPSRDLAVRLELATNGAIKDSDFTDEIRRQIHEHGGPS